MEVPIVMRRLALLLVCASVCMGFASRAAAAPEEEDLLFQAPTSDATASSARPARPAGNEKTENKKAEKQKRTAHKKPLSKNAGRAMASAHRRMATKARPAAVAASPTPAFYVGVHVGGGWSSASPPIDAGSVSGGGVIGGGQFGWNYQFGQLVFGVEGDVSASGVRGNVSGGIGGTPVSGSMRNDWFATLAGRVGFASGSMLSYLKAGAAWTQYKWNFSSGAGGAASASETRSGWVIGIGLERALTSTLSAKIEYNYMDFGHRTEILTTTGGLVALPSSVALDVHVVKIGLNHRFSY
jgi:outer membrane immunogenic protein